MRGLRWLIPSEGLTSIFLMLAIATPLVLFLDELGFSKSQIGLLRSLLHLTGPLALIIAPAVERFGLKRTYVVFLGSRKVVLCGMILLPWIADELGFEFALAYAVVVMGSYGLLRVIAETAMYPWMQEAIPNSVRGKVTAVAVMVATAGSVLAVLASGYAIDRYTGLWRYQMLIAVGCTVGLAAVLMRLKVPGGEPRRERRSQRLHFRQMKQALEDRNLLKYLLCMSLLVLGVHSWSTFSPLFLKDVVGLSQGQVVLLQSGTMLGGFVFSYLWGYAADRYGSKPVFLAGIGLLVCAPVGWLAMPVHGVWSMYWAATIAVVLGVGQVAWHIGESRLLYVNVVPAAKRMEYMALFYAVTEIIRFAGPLGSGLLLDYLKGRDSGIMPAVLGLDSPYETYFMLTTVLLALSVPALLRIRSVPVEDDTSDDDETAARQSDPREGTAG